MMPVYMLCESEVFWEFEYRAEAGGTPALLDAGSAEAYLAEYTPFNTLLESRVDSASFSSASPYIPVA